MMRGSTRATGRQLEPTDMALGYTRRAPLGTATRLTCAVVALLLALLPAGCRSRVAGPDDQRIRPYTENPFYWQYRGEPILLIGASDYHNIFQRPDLVDHLEILRAAGGNYVRNTMASREILTDHNDLWPFAIVEGTDDPLINVYDLTRWNDSYWERFKRMLDETAARDIIVEIELWERHDYYRTRDQAGWIRHPYNPDNNINYTPAESGLPSGAFPGPDEDQFNPPPHPFFASVPGLEHNPLLLGYQQAFVDKILSYSLAHDHVLYNMNNETQERNEWGEYWAEYVRAAAARRGTRIEMTDMQDAHDVTDDAVRRVMDSDLYTFVDISQNSTQRGDVHWERLQYIRSYLKNDPKPMTNIKIYGSDDTPPPATLFGSTRDGVERFWRNIIGGASSARFHRPRWGIGLSELAQAHVRSARMLADAMDIFVCEPRNDLLSDREPNEAFLLAEPGRQYAVYFPDGGTVTLDLSDASGGLNARWLDLGASRWTRGETINGGGRTPISAPADGHWLLLIAR